MTFGERIRELRKAKRMTLRDLAKKVDKDFTYLSKIENSTPDDQGNPTVPSAKLIIALADALDTEADALLMLAMKIPSSVNEWPREKGFQEFYRAMDTNQPSAEEWRKLAEFLRSIRNQVTHKRNSEK